MARQAVQDHLDLRAAGEELLTEVVDAEGIARSHGLRRLAVVEEAVRGSFGQAVDAIGRATGQRVGKCQVEALTVRAAVDVDGF